MATDSASTGPDTAHAPSSEARAAAAGAGSREPSADLKASGDHPHEPAPRTPQIFHTLPQMPSHLCVYLPDRFANDRGFAVHHMEPMLWQSFIDCGWRRSGMMIYQPACAFCAECKSLRIPVNRFHHSRNHRRCLRTNRDITVRMTPVTIDDERAALFRKYVTTRHDGMMSGSRREFELFLGATPVDTVELEYRVGGTRLVAIGTIDRLPSGFSCVYCYYDPAEASRSLGTFNILTAIRLCREWVLPEFSAENEAYLYLGYWIRGSRTMEYKANFKPHEYFEPTQGRWISVAM